jgi:hypothetical protein
MTDNRYWKGQARKQMHEDRTREQEQARVKASWDRMLESSEPPKKPKMLSKTRIIELSCLATQYGRLPADSHNNGSLEMILDLLELRTELTPHELTKFNTNKSELALDTTIPLIEAEQRRLKKLIHDLVNILMDREQPHDEDEDKQTFV